MIDYDTPSLDSLTITVLDGRDTIRASVTLTVNWPDLPLSVENIGLNGITTFEEEEEGEDGQVYVQKRGKNFLVEKSDVPKVSKIRSEDGCSCSFLTSNKITF